MPRRRNTPAPPKPLTDYPKKRCKNCPKFFYQTKPTREFCSDSCRMQFHRYGNSFGALKDKLEKLMRQESAPLVDKMFREFINSREFKRAMAAAGFIHRSQMKTRTKEERPAALLAGLRNHAGALQNLNQRISSIERELVRNVLGDALTAATATETESRTRTEPAPTPESQASPTTHTAKNSKALASLEVFRKSAKAADWPL